MASTSMQGDDDVVYSFHCSASLPGEKSEAVSMLTRIPHPAPSDYDRRTALHLAAANDRANILDYLLSFERLNINPLDRTGGTPLDDAIEHQNQIAKAMLLERGALSRHDGELQAMLKKVESERAQHDKDARLLRLKDDLPETPEGRGAVWVKGRCGKLIPLAMRQVDQLEMVLQAFLTQVTEAFEVRPEDGKDIAKRRWQAFSAPITSDKYEEQRRQRVVLLVHENLPKLDAWLEAQHEMHKYILEDLPKNAAIQWAASKYCHQREELLPEICKLISLGKFLRHELVLFEDIVANPEATLLRTAGQAAKMFQRKNASRGHGQASIAGSGQASAMGSVASQDRRAMLLHHSGTWSDLNASFHLKKELDLSRKLQPPAEKSPSPAVSPRSAVREKPMCDRVVVWELTLAESCSSASLSTLPLHGHGVENDQVYSCKYAMQCRLTLCGRIILS